MNKNRIVIENPDTTSVFTSAASIISPYKYYQELEKEIKEFTVGDIIKGCYIYGDLLGELIGFSECSTRIVNNKICDICPGKFKIKTKDYCPFNGNHVILFKVLEKNNFITEKEFLI